MNAPQLPFNARADDSLADRTLKTAIDRTTGTAERKRAAAIEAFPEFEAARARGRAIKDHVIANLGHYLEQFERNATTSGAQVHWAADDVEARAIVTRICLEAKAKLVTRSKSMLGEEIGLPHALADAGIERVETDLAEHIIQLAGEAPSHIIWPAMHRTREQVADLFKAGHTPPPAAEDPASMVQSARTQLRTKFLAADVGISGANFLVADTGATCTVTNEGNAELTTTPPRIHIVTAGIEKIVPSTAHAVALLRLLVRSATGGELTQYTTFHCGPKRAGDADGPEEMHIVLVDNGRTNMLADEFREMLRCIRCGACMNHCVVYRQIG
ncbi:LUD domain-containing protein, partial [Paracoccus sp. (in: a-proteobacteria)]|uniref:LUD domain-containing protein n=1 Tax=Paracoccus sp. TaxID=267 RepID=UPI003A843ABD